MNSFEIEKSNEASKQAWNQNAAYWDERMGEGNDFIEWLIWPAVARLLAVQPGEKVLDIACGNGLTSRRMAASGAEVVAFDFAEEMIEHAIKRTNEFADQINYHVLDATDERVLRSLGEGVFDGALCNMALFDMADIAPVIGSLKMLLKSKGRFVFSIMHPAFNGAESVRIAETDERDGRITTRHAVSLTSVLKTDFALMVLKNPLSHPMKTSAQHGSPGVESCHPSWWLGCDWITRSERVHSSVADC
jgi:2-polyprenyl-3-methyl-5-hydroxy-6-metoxy-1,4-benzoquinol methylase